ncbi:MAG: radical SAM family heme chaperone HemW [Bacillota bacterium]
MHNLNFKNTNAVYIHLPFCSSKCPYCDFYSIKYTKKRVDQYWAALFMEIEELSKIVKNNLVQTIYIGGGTPSLVEPELINELIKKIKSKFKVGPAAEITMEVNPASINEEKIISIKRAGINRLSVGIQSFNDNHLSFLGRRSNSTNNRKILALIDQYFDNYSADLIFALPDQSLKEFENDLEEMLDFAPPHISLYNLEIHENTPFYQKYNSGELKLPAEELDAEMYELALKKLTAAGYQHYEISNFSKPGYRARHNYIYWLYQPYAALGPGASGFDGNCRYQNIRDIDQYLKYYNPKGLSFKRFNEIQQNSTIVNLEKDRNKKIRKIDCLTKKEKMGEYSFLALRTDKGLFYHKFYKEFNLKFKTIYKDEINELKQNNLIIEENERIYLTTRGKEVANAVFLKFLLE